MGKEETNEEVTDEEDKNIKEGEQENANKGETPSEETEAANPETPKVETPKETSTEPAVVMATNPAECDDEDDCSDAGASGNDETEKGGEKTNAEEDKTK